MGFLQNLFGIKPVKSQSPRPKTYSASDIQVISASAQRMTDVINESMKIANSTLNPDTKISRLKVARKHLHELKYMCAKYPFLHLVSLDAVESDLDRIEEEFLTSGLQELAEGNMQGQALEKQGRIEEAISIYESLAGQGTDTPFTYRRLAILYHKNKDIGNEIRILKLAIKNVPKRNAQHWAWFADRLLKIQSRTKVKK